MGLHRYVWRATASRSAALESGVGLKKASSHRPDLSAWSQPGGSKKVIAVLYIYMYHIYMCVCVYFKGGSA